MNSILSKTDTRTKLEDLPRVRLMSRGQAYYRIIKPLMKETNEKGEVIKLTSRGVAYRKEVTPRSYKKPSADAINWRWRGELGQD
jgi:hypothetical protein